MLVAIGTNPMPLDIDLLCLSNFNEIPARKAGTLASMGGKYRFGCKATQRLALYKYLVKTRAMPGKSELFMPQCPFEINAHSCHECFFSGRT
ncbi:MAG TPA: hypothetical protein VFK06_25770 [Candidatus Angelobacter sp.]|nr:hypothetical protein [Candidatus Angelobacter sp.]